MDPDDLQDHPILQEALRESARHGFEKTLDRLFAKYAHGKIVDDLHTRGAFLDAGLLNANVLHHVNELPWKKAFMQVVQAVTSKPEGQRPVAVLRILSEYYANRLAKAATLVARVEANRRGV